MLPNFHVIFTHLYFKVRNNSIQTLSKSCEYCGGDCNYKQHTHKWGGVFCCITMFKVAHPHDEARSVLQHLSDCRSISSRIYLYQNQSDISCNFTFMKTSLLWVWTVLHPPKSSSLAGFHYQGKDGFITHFSCLQRSPRIVVLLSSSTNHFGPLFCQRWKCFSPHWWHPSLTLTSSLVCTILTPPWQ